MGINRYPRLKDESVENADDLPEPQDLAAEAITELEAVAENLRDIVALPGKEEGKLGIVLAGFPKQCYI